MKTTILGLALLVTMALGAQDYYTMYSFTVEPQNEAAVYKLVDDYYSENKPEGVFVRLFDLHFKDAAWDASHMIVFTGTQEAVGNMYSTGDDKFALFLTRLNQQIKAGSGSAMGRHIALYGDTNVRYPAQRMYLLQVKDTEKFDAEYHKFHSKHNPPGVIVNMGTTIVGQGTGKFNRWVLIGFKDMKAAMGGPNKLLSGSALTAREEAWDAFRANDGGVKVVGSGLRMLLGAW